MVKAGWYWGSAVGSESLRARCEKVVRELHLPQPFGLDAFRRSLAEGRNKSLTFHPLPQPTSPRLPSGMWLATERGDHIFYDAQTSPLHQRHIIFHELGHMLFDHNDRELEDNAILHAGSASPELIKRMLSRIRYSTPQEQEAEMTATLLLAKVGDIPASPRLVGAMAVLESALGYRGHR